ncbi:hypothetical protein, partial [Emticicia sp.]|uniref:hypothetical protein n=1 Tax=Emticicia sp. TaxID=1930953 RepID=UPI003751CA68
STIKNTTNMPYDITLCAGGDCPIKQFCNRHTAEILGRQDFFGSIPFDFFNKNCSFFIKNDNYFGHIRLKAFEIWEMSLNQSQNSLQYWQLAEEAFIYEFLNKTLL